MKRLIIAAAALLIAASTFAADGPPFPKGRWWRMPQVVSRLELTQDQQTKLDDIFNTSQVELIDLKADVDKLGVELRAQLEKPQSARKDVVSVASKLGAARSKLFEREIGMMVDMRSVLSSDQWTRLRGAMDEMSRRMRERGDAGDRPNRPKQNRPPNPG